MKTYKIIAHLADYSVEHPERCLCRCERVARNGVSQAMFRAYEPFWDEDVELSIVFLDWWDNSRVSPLLVPIEKLRNALERINFFAVEKI